MKLLIYTLLVAPFFITTQSSIDSEQVAYQKISTQIVYAATSTPEKTIDETIYCSCVETARDEGLNLPRGNAIDVVPNSTPIVGGGILFEYKPTIEGNHIALILEMRQDGFWVVEGNFKKCEKTYRLIDYNDPFIRGFWAEPKEDSQLSLSPLPSLQ